MSGVFFLLFLYHNLNDVGVNLCTDLFFNCIYFFSISFSLLIFFRPSGLDDGGRHDSVSLA